MQPLMNFTFNPRHLFIVPLEECWVNCPSDYACYDSIHLQAPIFCVNRAYDPNDMSSLSNISAVPIIFWALAILLLSLAVMAFVSIVLILFHVKKKLEQFNRKLESLLPSDY